VNCQLIAIPSLSVDALMSFLLLQGKYPNRNYPKIFSDAAVGAEAKKLFDDATATLKV
jgi:5-methyltetrahydrofolate--homocysteine methyltransferase